MTELDACLPYKSLNIIRLPAVIARTGLSRSSIYAYVRTSDFPPPKSIGKRAVGWLEKDVAEWLETRTTSAGASRHE